MKDTTERDVGHIEPTEPIEHRSFKEGVDLMSTAVGRRPSRRSSVPKAVRHSSEYIGYNDWRWGEE
jgi:hypothetical protein